MRSEYPLKNSRPNPYAARLGAKGRAELLEWWSPIPIPIPICRWQWIR
jgi:hypothetical protein